MSKLLYIVGNMGCRFLTHCFHIHSHHMPVRLKDSPKKQRSRLQFATWLGNITTLIIIADNDIYLKQSPSDEEDIRLTFSGESDLIYNGITDFLYQGKPI
jgi:inactive dipeptidyl peptidase 10